MLPLEVEQYLTGTSCPAAFLRMTHFLIYLDLITASLYVIDKYAGVNLTPKDAAETRE